MLERNLGRTLPFLSSLSVQCWTSHVVFIHAQNLCEWNFSATEIKGKTDLAGRVWAVLAMLQRATRMLPSPKPSDRQVNCVRRGSNRELNPKLAQKSVSVIAETTESLEGQGCKLCTLEKKWAQSYWGTFSTLHDLLVPASAYLETEIQTENSSLRSSFVLQ